MNYRLQTFGGDSFRPVAQRAKELSGLHGVVEFDFNGIKCVVSPQTNLDWLWRDYDNAHMMKWKAVGPDCLPEYDDLVLAELHRREKLAEERRETERKQYQEKERIERDAFNSKTSGVEIDLSDVASWNAGKEKNKDPYGACVYDYAEAWAKLMQIEIAKGRSIIDCADRTSHELGFFGITGFMYGAAVSVLSHCWKHGEELRKWHNKEYGHEGDGVVNPAILTLGSKP